MAECTLLTDDRLEIRDSPELGGDSAYAVIRVRQFSWTKVSLAVSVSGSTFVRKGEQGGEIETDHLSERQPNQRGTLIVSRRENESLEIGHGTIATILAIEEGAVELRLDVPPEMSIVKQERDPRILPPAARDFPPGHRVFWLKRSRSGPTLFTGIVIRWYAVDDGWKVALDQFACLDLYHPQACRINDNSGWRLCQTRGGQRPYRPYDHQVYGDEASAIGSRQ
jgi:sRNA-binding carbon storage regulator CsrA